MLVKRKRLELQLLLPLSLRGTDCAVKYKKGSRTLATVTISRDLQSLQAEVAMEVAIRRKDERSPE